MKKLIWTYWHQGFDQAPFVIQKCIQQVRKLHPEYTIHLLDERSVYEYADEVPIPREKWEVMSLPHRSDLLRTQLLVKYGGIWMDPTVFCVRPIGSWIHDNMEVEVFFFNRPGPDRILANWFIAAEPNNYVLTTLYQSLINYWNENDFVNIGRNRMSVRWMERMINGRSLEWSQLWFHPFVRKVLKIYPYMIYHFMAYKLVKNDSRYREVWDNMPKVSADGPHQLKRYGLLKEMNMEGKHLIKAGYSPLYKLDWNIDKSSISKKSLLFNLFKDV